ncbi:hypothetical protein SNEBB_003314 [Seison nebaliae]|nr:hypothetical protein SNEBB_003314 [Seison nebaliae]
MTDFISLRLPIIKFIAVVEEVSDLNKAWKSKSEKKLRNWKNLKIFEEYSKEKKNISISFQYLNYLYLFNVLSSFPSLSNRHTLQDKHKFNVKKQIDELMGSSPNSDIPMIMIVRNVTDLYSDEFIQINEKELELFFEVNSLIDDKLDNNETSTIFEFISIPHFFRLMELCEKIRNNFQIKEWNKFNRNLNLFCQSIHKCQENYHQIMLLKDLVFIDEMKTTINSNVTTFHLDRYSFSFTSSYNSIIYRSFNKQISVETKEKINLFEEQKCVAERIADQSFKKVSRFPQKLFPGRKCAKEKIRYDLSILLYEQFKWRYIERLYLFEYLSTLINAKNDELVNYLQNHYDSMTISKLKILSDKSKKNREIFHLEKNWRNKLMRNLEEYANSSTLLRIGLNNSGINLLSINSSIVLLTISINTIRYFGSSKNNFFLQLGRSSSIGENRLQLIFLNETLAEYFNEKLMRNISTYQQTNLANIVNELYEYRTLSRSSTNLKKEQNILRTKSNESENLQIDNFILKNSFQNKSEKFQKIFSNRLYSDYLIRFICLYEKTEIITNIFKLKKFNSLNYHLPNNDSSLSSMELLFHQFPQIFSFVLRIDETSSKIFIDINSSMKYFHMNEKAENFRYNLVENFEKNNLLFVQIPDFMSNDNIGLYIKREEELIEKLNEMLKEIPFYKLELINGKVFRLQNVNYLFLFISSIFVEEKCDENETFEFLVDQSNRIDERFEEYERNKEENGFNIFETRKELRKVFDEISRNYKTFNQNRYSVGNLISINNFLLMKKYDKFIEELFWIYDTNITSGMIDGRKNENKLNEIEKHFYLTTRDFPIFPMKFYFLKVPLNCLENYCGSLIAFEDYQIQSNEERWENFFSKRNKQLLDFYRTMIKLGECHSHNFQFNSFGEKKLREFMEDEENEIDEENVHKRIEEINLKFHLIMEELCDEWHDIRNRFKNFNEIFNHPNFCSLFSDRVNEKNRVKFSNIFFRYRKRIWRLLQHHQQGKNLQNFEFVLDNLPVTLNVLEKSEIDKSRKLWLKTMDEENEIEFKKNNENLIDDNIRRRELIKSIEQTTKFSNKQKIDILNDQPSKEEEMEVENICIIENVENVSKSVTIDDEQPNGSKLIDVEWMKKYFTENEKIQNEMNKIINQLSEMNERKKNFSSIDIIRNRIRNFEIWNEMEIDSFEEYLLT